MEAGNQFPAFCFSGGVMDRGWVRAAVALFALAAAAGLAVSCGVRKKADAAKSAIEGAKALGRELSGDAGKSKGGAEERAAVDKLMRKAGALSGVSYRETASYEGKQIKGEIFVKGGKTLRHSWQDGNEYLALVEGSSITFVDMKGKSGFKQATDSPEDARGMIDILSGNLFIRPDKMLKENEDLRKTGSETVSGQPCEVYEIKYGLFGASAAVKVWLSKEYGIVMKASLSGVQDGKDTQAYTYEITGFSASGVSDSDFKLPGDVQIIDMASIGKDAPVLTEEAAASEEPAFSEGPPASE
jgi:outer membrane lipoprotein-sorting protein